MSLPIDWNTGGDALAPKQNNKYALRDILHALTGLTAAQMTAIKPQARFANMPAQLNNGLRYFWHNTTALAADGFLVVDADDTPALGAWLLAAGQEALFSMPIGFGTADAAALLTIPAGCLLIPRDFWWTISVDFAGGSSSAIGVSASVGPDTKGDLLGGAAGDIATNLEAADSPTWGTIGLEWDTVAERRIFLAAATVLRFDRITSVFTSGAGTVEMLARVVANAGA
jgi:hypothetical protein